MESDEAAPGSSPSPAPARTYSPPAPAPQPQATPVRTFAAPVAQAPPTTITYQLPPTSSQQHQPLGGYTPINNNRYAPPPPPAPAAPLHQPTAYRAPSPLPNYSAALAAQLSQANAALRGAHHQPQSLPSYSATLAQRQPTMATLVGGRPAHLASIPRSISPVSSPSLSSLGSSFSTATEPQESTTWGPPVINKELLSYNIGIGSGR